MEVYHQAVWGCAVCAGAVLCLCGVPQTDAVSVDTVELWLVSSFYKIQALISISITSIKLYANIFLAHLS